MTTTPAPARRISAREARARSATRWAVAVLALATSALLVWAALVVAATALFAFAYDVVTGREPGAVDLLGVARSLAPGLLAGWCCGMAAVAVLGPGEALTPRIAGVLAGVLGVLAGVVVMRLGGVPVL